MGLEVDRVESVSKDTERGIEKIISRTVPVKGRAVSKGWETRKKRECNSDSEA